MNNGGVKSKTGFLGIGAYGGNQVSFFHKAGYPALFVNTAQSDLDSLKDVPDENKYHITGGEGCNKERKKSIEIFFKDLDNVINKVKETLAGVEYLFIVGSAGGGTASGVLAKMKLLLMQELELKACIIVTVIPNTRTESIKALLNCYETLAEIESDTLEESGATFILDNDKNNNKMRINEQFFTYLDALLTSNESSIHGNVDLAEIEKLLSTPGMAIISKLGRDKSNTQQLISTFNNNIYAPLEQDKVITYIGLIQTGIGRDIRIEDIQEEVGTPFDTFTGYEADATICMLAGLSLPYTKMEEIKQKIDANKDVVKRNLTAQKQKKLSGSLGFFDDITEEKSRATKKKNSRDNLFSVE